MLIYYSFYQNKLSLDINKFLIIDTIITIILLYRCSQNLVMQYVDHSAGSLIDLLHGLLKFDPLERLTAREALRHPFFGGQR